MKALISIIVPVYRVEKYLFQCIDSIINQSYKCLEIILVDDGSDDSSGNICDEFARIDNRIKVLHKQNGGSNEARKVGFMHSSGEYIGYVDGDDWIEPEMYETLLRDALMNDVAIVESGVIDTWEDYDKERIPYFKEGIYKGKRFDEIILPSFLYTGDFFSSGITPYLCSKLFKRSIVEKYQLNSDSLQDLVDDVFITFPAIVEARSIYIEKGCYYHYRVNNSSLRHTETRGSISQLLSIEDCFRKKMLYMIPFEWMEYQIRLYTMYIILCKMPFVFDDAEECLFPFGGVSKTEKIILYGAGSVGLHIKAYLKKKGINVVKWVDARFRELNSIEDISNPEDIKSVSYDVILISVMRSSAAINIRKRLLSMGVDEKKIRWIKQDYIENPQLLIDKAIKVNGNDCLDNGPI